MVVGRDRRMLGKAQILEEAFGGYAGTANGNLVGG
jgi:hypothetical protein